MVGVIHVSMICHAEAAQSTLLGSIRHLTPGGDPLASWGFSLEHSGDHEGFGKVVSHFGGSVIPNEKQVSR